MKEDGGSGSDDDDDSINEGNKFETLQINDKNN